MSNRLPALSLVSCVTCVLLIIGVIEVIHQNVTVPQVVPDGIQIVPVPYFLALDKASGNRIGTGHVDGSLGSINIGDGTHITTSPFDKAVSLLSLGRQVDHCSRGIGRSPLAGGGYLTAFGAKDGEHILITITAY